MGRNSLLGWLLALTLIAFIWPSISPLSSDPFVLSRPYLGLLISLTMFAIGCLLPRDEIDQVLRRWPTVLAGTGIQYISMPALAFGVAHLFPLDSDMLTGLIMVGCVPGAMASNVLTLAARGNVSYSVSLTTTSTLLSPIMVPLALWLTLGSTHDFDALQVAGDLLQQVVLPVLAGHLLCRQFARVERLMSRVAPIAANATILWIIAVVVGVNREILDETRLQLVCALLVLNVLGYAAGAAGGRALGLPDAMRRALTLEVGMQNAGLGTVLVLQMFPSHPRAAIATAGYTVGCMLTGTVLAQIWSRRRVTLARNTG